MYKQREVRMDLAVRFPVYLENEPEPLGYMQNMSSGGMMIVSGRTVPLGKTLRLRMRLPEPVDEVTEIRFTARTLWQEPDANPKLSTTGLQFKDMAHSDFRIVHELIPRYCFTSVPEVSSF